MLHKTALALLSLPCLTLFGGMMVTSVQAKEDRFEWPQISSEELALKAHSGAPGAHALILLREVHCDDVKSLVTHYFRIKVLTDQGKKYADIEIPYMDKQSRVEYIRARTVRSDGTAVDFKGQVFDKVLVKAKKQKLQAKTFTLPEVDKGYIIEYSYSIHYHNNVPDAFKNPQNYIIQGVHSLPTVTWIVDHELFTRRARFAFRPLAKGNVVWSWMWLPKGAAPSRQTDGTIRLELENIPGFQEEEFMPPKDMLRIRVDFFYVLGFLGTSADFWTQEGKRRAEIFEKFLGKPKDMERAVAEMVRPDDLPETKLRKLYARAQKVRYVSYEQPKTEAEGKRENLRENETAEDVLKRGYGFANEINLFFTALARAAGFDASVVLVAGRYRSYFRQNLLDPRQLNAMVVAVRVGSEEIFLDPATLYCPFGLLPWEETSTAGIRAHKSGGVSVTTPEPKSSDAVIERNARLKLDASGVLEGGLTVAYIGQEALQRRLDAHDEDQAGRRKRLEDEVKGWLPEGATVRLERVSNWESSEELLEAEFAVKIQGLASLTGRRMLAPLAVFHVSKKQTFSHTKRLYPVYFPYPFQEADEVTLELPESCRIESIPAARKNSTAIGSYDISYEKQGGGLKMRRRLTLDGFLFPLNAYPALRSFYEGAKAGDEQPVVLQFRENGPPE